MLRNYKKIKGLFEVKLPNLINALNKEIPGLEDNSSASLFHNGQALDAALFLSKNFTDYEICIEGNNIYLYSKIENSMIKFTDNFSENGYPSDFEYEFEIELFNYNETEKRFESHLKFEHSLDFLKSESMAKSCFTPFYDSKNSSNISTPRSDATEPHKGLDLDASETIEFTDKVKFFEKKVTLMR